MSIMPKRKFSKEQKIEILKESQENGVNITLEKHGIYPATFYSWKQKYETMGEAGFRHGMTPEHLKEIKRLEKENATLKKLLAEKELEGHLKDELLKKRYAWARKNK
jgi:putative transposase